MPADSPIPLPGDAIIEWRNRHPQAADELVRAVNLLMALELKLVVPTAYNPAKEAIARSGTNYALILPLKFSAPIANSTATAANVSTQLNSLLAALRSTGQLPA